MAVLTLKTRRQFLRVRGGSRCAKPAFVLECKARASPSSATPQFGFTVTKQLGGAVVRNRVRRRLKAAVSGLASNLFQPCHDYVLIARAPASECPFDVLMKDLEDALRRVHDRRAERRPESARRSRPSKAQ